MFFDGYMTVERTGEFSGNFTVTIKGDGRDSPCGLYNFNGKHVRVNITELTNLRNTMMMGTFYKDYCDDCRKNVFHKLIAFNKFDNPVYECLECGKISVDEVNEQDGI